MKPRPLIGRESEVKELAAALDALSQGGSPPILQLVGEPGIGKSRMLAELASMAEARGFVVLRGRAGEFESALPFGVFVDALESHLSSIDSGRWQGLEPWLPELATVFSTFVGLASGRTGPVHAERYRTYRAVRSLLEELARSSPIVLGLDDIHWCDAASAELIAHLLTHPTTGGVLLAVAVRPTQTDPPLAAALDSAAREGRASRMALHPLTAEEAKAFLGHCPSQLHEQLYRESGGNPFYLEQLARVDPAQASASPTLPDRTPDAVRAALAAELASLSPPAQELLRGASVVGDPFDADLAARAADQDADEVSQALDELAAYELIRTRAMPGMYQFRHPLVRRAIYDTSGPSWRLKAHSRVAKALEQRGAGAELLAHHLERFARPGDLAAIDLLVQAAHATSARAPLTAARWFEAAVHLLPDSPEHDQRRRELLVLMAVELGAGGRTAQSHAVLEQAVERLPFDNPERATVVAFLAGLDNYLGRFEQGRERLLIELGRLGTEPSLARAALEIELAVGATFLADVEDLHARAATALESSRAIGHRLFTIVSTGILAHAELTLGHFHAAAALLRDGAAGYDSLDDDELAARIDATHWLAMPEISLGLFDEAIRHCQRGIDLSRATGRGHWLVPLMHTQVYAFTARGRLVEADEVAQNALETARLGGQVAAVVIALYDRCMVATAQGDLAGAVRAGDEGLALARTFAPSVPRAMVALALARALVEMDEPERARHELLATCGGPDLPLVPTVMRATAYETLVRAELGLGRVDHATDWAERAESASGGDELPLGRAAANQARAAVLLATGHAAEAAGLALTSAQAALRVGAVIDAGVARVLAGRALAQAKERQQALAVLDAAYQGLAAAGAGYQRRAVAELRRLGRRPAWVPGRDDGSPPSLTPREREIALLVATGSTNREIASACYLSEKTVESHLSKIFAKLGVSSRRAIAAAADRL